MRDAIEQLLRAHEPNPALVVDRHWGLVSANRAVAVLIAGVSRAAARAAGERAPARLHPDGLAPRIANLGSGATIWWSASHARRSRRATPRWRRCATSSRLSGRAGERTLPFTRRSPCRFVCATASANCVHQHADDVRHGRRRDGRGVLDRVVLPRGRRDRGCDARAGAPPLRARRVQLVGVVALTTVVVVVLVIALRRDLTPDLTCRERGGVHVRVREAQAQSPSRNSVNSPGWMPCPAGPMTCAAVMVPLTVPDGVGQAGVPAGPLPRLLQRNAEIPPLIARAPKWM